MELYWFSGSPHSWRVMLALGLKRVAYVSTRMDPATALGSPEFRALNHRGKAPVLIDGDLVLPESLAIITYLDRLHPAPGLFGATAAEAAQVWRTAIDFDLYSKPSFYGVIGPVFFNQVAGAEAAVEAAAQGAAAELTALQNALGDRDWLVGDAVSAADLAIYPDVEALLRAAAKPEGAALTLNLLPFGDRWPKLQAWRDRICKLPGYDDAYPPHWRG